MTPWLGVLLASIVLLSVWAVTWIRCSGSRTSGVVLRLDTSNDPNVPLTVVNAGRDPIFQLEATLRFEGRAPGPEQVMERHRRALVLLPGERLAFPLPENMAGREAPQLTSHVVRVRLDAVGRDQAGRTVDAQDMLEDPMAWIESERRSRASAEVDRPSASDVPLNTSPSIRPSRNSPDLEHDHSDTWIDPSPEPSGDTANAP